ncbi:MAG: CopG family transcriptional regulator [Dehalococcoidia bacterium]
MPATVTRTTLAIPADLLAAVDEAVCKGKARSRNAFVAGALQRELAAIRRAEIDASFIGMGDDDEYQEEAKQISAEFAQSDWEAFLIGEAKE